MFELFRSIVSRFTRGACGTNPKPARQAQHDKNNDRTDSQVDVHARNALHKLSRSVSRDGAASFASEIGIIHVD